MKHIITLTRMQLGSAFDFLKLKRKKDRKKNVSAISILVVGFLLFTIMSFTYSISLGVGLELFGELDILPGLLMSITCVITLVTTIYKVKGTLFGFKDYDIVMSLPVKTSSVVASRILLLYIINFFFTFVVMVPGFLVYGFLAEAEALFYFLALVSLFFIPLVPIIVASVIGIIIAAVSSRFKYSNAINTVLMIVFFTGVFIASFTLQNEQQLVQFGSIMRNQMNRLYPLASLYLKGLIEFNLFSFVLFLLISILAFAVYINVVGRVFRKLNSVLLAKHSKMNYELKSNMQQSALKALYQKEIKRYLSTGIYVFNTSFGIIMLVLASIGLFFMQPEQFKFIIKSEPIRLLTQQILPLAIAAMLSMVTITASSISLEGKNLWIIKSAPIKVSDWLLSKILVSLSFTIPTAVISGIFMGIHVKSGVMQILWNILIPVSYSYLTAVLGLVVNLKFPIFDWTNETVVVKQSAAALIVSFMPIITVGPPCYIYFNLGDGSYSLLMIGTFLLVMLLACLVHKILNLKGQNILAKL